MGWRWDCGDRVALLVWLWDLWATCPIRVCCPQCHLGQGRAGRQSLPLAKLIQTCAFWCNKWVGEMLANTGEKVFYFLKSILNQWHHLLAAIPIVTVPGGVAGPWGCGTAVGTVGWAWDGRGDLRGHFQPECFSASFIATSPKWHEALPCRLNEVK